LPIVTYGAATWYDRVDHSHVRRNLSAAQRAILLLLTKAYRTAATSSLQIVAAKLPLDLEVVRFGLRRRLKQNEDSKWRGYEFRRMANRLTEIKVFNEKIEDEADREWQFLWNSKTRAEITHSFIRDVKMGRNDWFKLTRRTVFVLTGHLENHSAEGESWGQIVVLSAALRNP